MGERRDAAAGGGAQKPAQCLSVVGANAVAVIDQHIDIVHGNGMALFGGPEIPMQRERIIAHNAFAVLVFERQFELGFRVTGSAVF